jgi:hypothetical protein
VLGINDGSQDLGGALEGMMDRMPAGLSSLPWDEQEKRKLCYHKTESGRTKGLYWEDCRIIKGNNQDLYEMIFLAICLQLSHLHLAQSSNSSSHLSYLGMSLPSTCQTEMTRPIKYSDDQVAQYS